jgi:alkanesulfonate monooxygenase SsuD/methylene tetrahydromethanopterin reductase-like flavin-dependent oxidoreductase (luciferase family)
MKVSLFQQFPYRHLPEGFETKHDSVVTAPFFDIVDQRLLGADLTNGIAELLHAARLGFDGVAVTEHSQSSYDMMPNPDLVGAILAYVTQAERLPVAINILGRSLGKSKEPLRVAEEYALIDAISGGRLIAGFPIGLSYDVSQNAGVPPIETRERYYEARDLIEKAWSAREPFAWNGKFYKYSQVNLWPRPVQQPKPPIWVPAAGNPKTMEEALKRDDVYTFFSWFGAKLTGHRIFDRFWQIAEQLGKDTNPHRVAFLQVVLVGETDAQAEKDYARHLESHFRRGIGAIPVTGFALPGYIDIRGVEALMRDPGDLGLAIRMRNIDYASLVDAGVAIVGSPATVRQKLEALVKEFRIGNLLTMLQVGSMPHELTMKNIELFAKEVLPGLRGIWNDEGWPDHAWPAGLAGAGAQAAVGGRHTR